MARPPKAEDERTAPPEVSIEANRMLRLVLDTIPVRVFWKDRESRYLGCNRHFAEDGGLSDPNEIVGLTDFDLGWADQAELYRADDRSVMESGTPRLRYEEPQTTPDGATSWLRTSKIPLRDMQGDVIGMLGVYEDITSQKEAEAERLRLRSRVDRSLKLEAMGEMAVAVAHDFNNLLTVIGGNAELLLDQARGADDQQPILEVLQAQQTAAGLTQQLLTISKKQARQPRVLDLASVVNRLDGMLRSLAGDGIDLRIVADPATGCARIDPVHAEQIALNLVVNAREAIPDRGTIEVRTEQRGVDAAMGREHELSPGSYAALVVSDTGVGINDDTLSRIFDPYFSTKGESGSGLGLATTLGIVDQCGGRILVDSEVGRGSTFTVLLPLVTDQQADPDPDPIVRLPHRGGRVLLVEDEAPVRNVVAGMLRRGGHTVLEAVNGRDALRTVAKERVDLVITDVAMPEMNGRELAAELERLDPGTAVLFVSGYVDDELLTLDAAHLLPKPFSQAELLSRVASLLGRSKPHGP